MIITILSEPRSGSTNLAEWFSLNQNFTVFQEPYNSNGIDYKRNIPFTDWKYNTPHLLIKEVFNADDGEGSRKINEIIKYSDKIILLFRENVKEQLESWLVATQTKKWNSIWIVHKTNIKFDEGQIDYFNTLKENFHNQFLSNQNFFKISYEDLYYHNGIEKIINYLNLECVTDENFPIGSRYRIENIKHKSII